MSPTFRALYKTVDNCKIYADVYLPPPQEESQKRPVVLLIHGGAFCLGHSAMVSLDQINDMLSRGWIVISPEHRLCPQVSILDGPISDIRSCLDWVHNGSLQEEITKQITKSSDREGLLDLDRFEVDYERVAAVGTSSGGTLALALGFNVPRKVSAILNFYGATHFTHDFWSSPLASMKAPPCPQSFTEAVYSENPIPTRDDVSLEGQTQLPSPPLQNPSSPTNPPPIPPRVAFALTQIANGTLMDVCLPDKNFKDIDACLNIDKSFPPTCIVHGTEDTKVPIFLSKVLFERLVAEGVEGCEFVEVEGEEHTFVGQMVVGSRTWERQRKGFEWLEGRFGRG